MSNVMTCQMSWNVKCHEMSNVMKCQMSWNVKCHEMSNVIKCKMSWNAGADAGYMTPSRNTRSYTLRSVPSFNYLIVTIWCRLKNTSPGFEYSSKCILGGFRGTTTFYYIFIDSVAVSMGSPENLRRAGLHFCEVNWWAFSFCQLCDLKRS